MCRYVSSEIFYTAVPTENPACFMAGVTACVYISTFEANLDSELNSWNFHSNILFFLWAQNSYEMKYWVLFQSKNRISQVLFFFFFSWRNRGVSYFLLRKDLLLYYIKFLTFIVRGKKKSSLYLSSPYTRCLHLMFLFINSFPVSSGSLLVDRR